MPGTTTYYELVTYGTEDDTFLNFRTAIAGPTASNSNMEKIGNALHAHDTSIASLQNTRGALTVAATYVSPGYYEGTNSLITAYVADMTIALKLSATSSGTTTLKIGALATKSLMKINAAGTAVNLTGNDLVLGRYYLFRFDSVADAWIWIDQVIAGEDGWTWAGETWSYASSTTFTIAGVDRTAIFKPGVKIKLTQTTAKYFYVVSSSFSTNTTVTITGGSDYTLANAAISENYYSRVSNPVGFPAWFNYVPTWSTISGTAPSLGDGTLSGRFTIIGSIITVTGKLVFGSTTTGGSGGGWAFALPVAVAGSESYYGFGYSRDSATANYTYICQVNNVQQDLRYFMDVTKATNNSLLTNTSPYTMGQYDSVNWQIQYAIA